MTSKFTIAAIAASIATIGLTAPASAEQVAETRIAAVPYADLDLGTDAGQRALQNRVQRAAREVCGLNERSAASLLPYGSAYSCYNRAVRNIDREVAARTQRAAQQRG